MQGIVVSPNTISRCTGARIDRATHCAVGLIRAMDLYGIDTPARQAMFLANIGHETGGLKWLTEIWGPTPAQKRYEGRIDLGNTQPGDGARFKGHGMLQTTGRFNHAAVRDRLRKRFPDLGVPDFEEEPERLAEPEWAALSAADYIAMKDCQRFADAGDFDGYCDTINRGRKTAAEGDSNGWDDRLALYNAAMAVLS